MTLILSSEPAAAPPGGGNRYLRLQVTKLTQAATWVYLADVRFVAAGVAYPTSNMTSNSAPSPLVASATSFYSAGYDPYLAVDSNATSTGWCSLEAADGSGVLAVPQALTIDLGAGNSVTPTSIRITPSSTYYPADFTVAVSNDNASWTTLGTFTSITSGWSAAAMREFTF